MPNAKHHRLDVNFRLAFFGHHNRWFRSLEPIAHESKHEKSERRNQHQSEVSEELRVMKQTQPRAQLSAAKPALEIATGADQGAQQPTPRSDRDYEQAVFTNFWYAAVSYQIHKGLSNVQLSKALGLSDKTVDAWNDCILDPHVIEALLDEADNLPPSFRTPHTERVRDALSRRLFTVALGEDARGSRAGAGLPTSKVFRHAVLSAQNNVLVHYVMGLGPRSYTPSPSRASTSLAERLAQDLCAAYKNEETGQLKTARKQLLRKLADLAGVVSHLTFLRANSSFPSLHGVDPGLDEQAQDLLADIDQAAADAESAVDDYVRELYGHIVLMDQLSDAMSFVALRRPGAHANPGLYAPPISAASVNAYAKEHVARLTRLIAHLKQSYLRV